MAAQQMTITLPEHLAAFVANRMTGAGYTGADDVVVEALELLWADEVLARREVDEEAVAAYAAYQADPSDVFTSAEVLAHVRGRRDATIAAE